MSTQTFAFNNNEFFDSSVTDFKTHTGWESLKDFTYGVISDPAKTLPDEDKLINETIDIKQKPYLPIIYPINRIYKKDNFISLQKWEGAVLEIKKDSFMARLIDLTKESPYETAEIPLEEVSEDDRDLLKEGAVFYWNIGYLNKTCGQKERVSLIRFRRLPSWSKEEIDAAKCEAERIKNLLGWE